MSRAAQCTRYPPTMHLPASCNTMSTLRLRRMFDLNYGHHGRVCARIWPAYCMSADATVSKLRTMLRCGCFGTSPCRPGSLVGVTAPPGGTGAWLRIRGRLISRHVVTARLCGRGAVPTHFRQPQLYVRRPDENWRPTVGSGALSVPTARAVSDPNYRFRIFENHVRPAIRRTANPHFPCVNCNVCHRTHRNRRGA